MPKKRIHCDYEGCTRSYCSTFNLKRHIESSHFGLRKFKCQLCGRQLSSKQNLIDHQNIHSGAKPYKCEIQSCNMEFRQLSQYYLHKQLHAEVSSHINHYNTSELNLQYLMQKLSTENSFIYSIPTLPYSLQEAELPKISFSPVPVKLPLLATLRSKVEGL